MGFTINCWVADMMCIHISRVDILVGKLVPCVIYRVRLYLYCFGY